MAQTMAVMELLWEHLFGINILLAVMIIFFERRDPKTIWSWLLLLYFIPVLGFLLYLLFGQDMRKSRMFKNKELEDVLLAAVSRQEQRVKMRELFSGEEEELKDYSDLVMYNLTASRAVYTDDNEVTVYEDGRKYFAALYEDLRSAKEFIHMQSYIVRNDELWNALEELLAKKVREGIQVRLLYDSMGCRKMRRKDWERIQSLGIETAEFFPAFFKRFHLRVNYRNHRKILVVDGKTAYVGGFNIGREYVGLEKKIGYWRDTHIRLSGSAAISLHVRFISDWNYAAGQDLFEKKNLIREFPPGKGTAGVQIISSGPDTPNQEIRNNYQKLIGKAKDHVYIQTPYFVPDEVVLSTIKMAAYSGIDVQIMIPCKPDHPLVYWAGYSYIGELVTAGVKCYTYNRGFLHAKCVMTDGMVCCCGTANMDIRSFALNFEVNATIYSPQITKKMEEIFKRDLEYCTRITPERYADRGLGVRIKEQFSRLFSFVL